jgi:hypothetical protein
VRTKKRVLLCCQGYERRNDQVFLLRVRCTWARFETFHCVEDMDVAIEDGEPFDCLVVVLKSGDEDEAVAVDRIMRHPEALARSVEVRAKGDSRPSSVAGRFVVEGNLAELAEAIWTASVRKRGPRRPSAAQAVEKEMVV